jgi:hypothetical protein
MSPRDRTLRGKVTGLFFGIQAQPEELNRLEVISKLGIEGEGPVA